MRFCGANASGPPRKRFHSPLDRPVASVTLASRDPTPRSSRDSPCSHRRSDGLCSCPVDERRKEKESARRNAGGHFADPFGNAGADREAKTGRAKVEIEKESDADSHAESKGKKDTF